MRVIFKSPSIRTKHKDISTGEIVDGTAFFTAVVYEPGEQIPNSRGAQRGFSMREWRSRLQPGKGIGTGQLKEVYVGGLPLVVVPPKLTDPLPDDATLAIWWTFIPEGL